MVNPEVKLPLDQNLLNNGLRLGPLRRPFRTWERLTFAAQELGLQGILP